MPPDAEGRPRAGPKYPPHERADAIRNHGVHREEVAGVGGDRITWPLRSVQGQSKELPVGHPKVAVQCPAGLRSRRLSPVCGRRGPSPASQPRVRPVGRHRVSLDFDHGYGWLDPQMIVRSVFPTLMEESVRILASILDVSVRVSISELDHPAVRRLDRVPQFFEERRIARRLDIRIRHDQEEEGAIDAAVVREFPIGELFLCLWIEPMLVENLPRLFLRCCIHPSSLEGGENPQGRGRDRRVDGESLPRGDEGVTAKESGVSWLAGQEVPLRGPELTQVLSQTRPDGLHIPVDLSTGYPIARPEPRSNKWIRSGGKPITTLVPASPSKVAATSAFNSLSPTFRSKMVASPRGSVV